MMNETWAEKTILVVEDDEISLEFLKELLEPYNVGMLFADNGKKALDVCRENPDIALVLMDVQLPVMNGRESMKEIKKINPDTPVVAQTAFAMSGDKERYLREGFDAYISKPINVRELIAIIEKFLG